MTPHRFRAGRRTYVHSPSIPDAAACASTEWQQMAPHHFRARRRSIRMQPLRGFPSDGIYKYYALFDLQSPLEEQPCTGTSGEWLRYHLKQRVPHLDCVFDLRARVRQALQTQKTARKGSTCALCWTFAQALSNTVMTGSASDGRPTDTRLRSDRMKSTLSSIAAAAAQLARPTLAEALQADTRPGMSTSHALELSVFLKKCWPMFSHSIFQARVSNPVNSGFITCLRAAVVLLLLTQGHQRDEVAAVFWCLEILQATGHVVDSYVYRLDQRLQLVQ